MNCDYSQKLCCWGRLFIKGLLVLILLGIGFDYAKHWALKRILEKEIAASNGLVSYDSFTTSLWPLLQSHLVFHNFKVNVSGTPLGVGKVKLRQGWREWHLAHIKAEEIKSTDTVAIQNAQGILDTSDLNARIKVSDLNLSGIQAKLPHISFSGPKASFNFLYELATHQLSLQADAPELSFTNGATFGLSGQGNINTEVPIQGKMDVKIKNIDKMLKELVAVGAVESSQADLLLSGSNFLGKIGLHDISLPLTIENGVVSLGPLSLFKVGGKGS